MVPELTQELGTYILLMVAQLLCTARMNVAGLPTLETLCWNICSRPVPMINGEIWKRSVLLTGVRCL